MLITILIGLGIVLLGFIVFAVLAIANAGGSLLGGCSGCRKQR